MAVQVGNSQNMKFTKTETEYNMKSLRFMLLIITTMFIVIAGVMIVLGFSVYSHFHTYTFFWNSMKSGNLTTPSLMCILLGMFLLIVTIFGFFGTLKKSTCMVNLYAFILIILLILKMVVVILALNLDEKTILEYISIPISDYTTDPEIRDEIDYLQSYLHCCGSNSYLDYTGMEFTSNHSTVVVSTHVDGAQISVVVPESCCLTRDNVFCQRIPAASCKTALFNLTVHHASVIGMLGVSVMFVQLLGIVFALLLARSIRKFKSEKAFMAWKLREQMIIARMNIRMDQEKLDAQDNSVYIAHADSSTA